MPKNWRRRLVSPSFELNMAGPLGRLVLLISLVSAFVLGAFARRATGTIDDASTDLGPGYDIAFLPAKNGHWNDQSGCTDGNAFCLSQVDRTLCKDTTWTATGLYAASGRSIVIDFVGDRISAFFTLVDAGPRNLSTRCSFTMDNGPPVPFEHTQAEIGTTHSFQYQQQVFSSGLLGYGPHKLVISIAASEVDINYLNFDYAEYSFDDEIPVSLPGVATTTVTATPQPTSSNDLSKDSATASGSSGVFKAAIIGGSISGTIVVVAIVLFFIWRARYKKAQPETGDRLTFGVPSTYAGSTRKLSLPFWPNGPPGDNSSQLRNLTPFPDKRSSYGTGFYSEKYEDEFVASPPPTQTQHRDRASTISNGPMLSPANALIQSFFPYSPSSKADKRGSATTGKLSRLEDSLSPSSNFPRHLQRLSEVRTPQDTTSASGVTRSSSNVLPLSPDTGAGRPGHGSYYAV